MGEVAIIVVPMENACVNRRQPRDPLDRLDPAARAATRWFVTLHEDPADNKERTAFEAWRNADPAHAEAYARLQRLWGASGHLPSLTSTEDTSDRRRVLRGAGMLALGGAVLLGGGRLALGPYPLADHRTGVGERRTVALGDGSIAELSTDTAISITFDKRERHIRLIQGEAWFQVSRDESGRPFVVEAAGGTTTALGTAFAVATEENEVLVTVTEHAVQISAGSQLIRVEAGQSCRYGGAAPARATVSDAASLAWRQGRLVFVSRPLGEVVLALDRWRTGRTIITDDRLAAHLVTLMIDTKDADDALTQLGSTLPMRILQVTPLLTFVRSAS